MQQDEVKSIGHMERGKDRYQVDLLPSQKQRLVT